MEQMEVTPVPLDDDNSGNINIVSSNPLTANEVNYLLNPSVNAIAMHSESDKSDPSVNEELTLEIKANNNSVSCQSEKLPEIFDNSVQISNDIHSAEGTERNADFKTENGPTKYGTETNYVGNCKSGFHKIDEACSSKSVLNPSASQSLPDVSGEIIQNVMCNSDINSLGFTTANLSKSSIIADDFQNKTLITKDGTTKVICETQTIPSSKSESEYDICKASTIKKECDVTGKPFQFDNLPKQTSEIKERVMGFLTKYTIEDEPSCSSSCFSSALPVSKQECLEGKQSQVLHEKNSVSKIIWGEECQTVNPKKASNDVTTQNSEEADSASPHIPKFHLASVSKTSVKENCSQTSNVFPSSNNTFTQQKDAINQQTVCTAFVSPVPSQSSFNFNISNDKSLSSTLLSPSKDLSPLQTPNNVMESHESDNTSESNNDCSFKPNSEIKLDRSEQETTQNSQSFNLKSDVQSISMCISPEKNAEGIKPQNELNSGNKSIEFLSLCNNDSFGNKNLDTPSNKPVTSPFLTATSMNLVSCTFQRSINTDSVNSWLSWGKMSGELHTTPSINSPILSSKSSNDSISSKHIPFPNNSFSPNIWPDNSELASKSGSKSRRTRSSDSMFFNIPKSFSNGATSFSSSGNSISHKCDNSFSVKPGEIGETNLSRSSFVNFEYTSKMSLIPQQNINKNYHGMIGNCLGKSTYCASGESLHSEYKCFEKPFGNNINKGDMDNPFTKKSHVECIDLFKSHIKSAVCENENVAFKPASSLLFPFKKEKTEECTGVEDLLGSGILKAAASNDSFGFRIKNKHNQAKYTSTGFAFSNLCSNESCASTNKKNSSCGETSNEDIGEQTPFDHFERVPSRINSNSLFQFTFTPEKPKTFSNSTVSLPRTKKPVKTIKHFQKVTLKDVKDNIPSNVSGKGIEEIPFKPVYGSDVKFEKGMYKNVIVRYQNIVFMDDHTHVSPEELRSQFYSKANFSGPFKFGACIESRETLCKDVKKTQNQEIQTDEHHTSKTPDLTAIWRVLECPVCLDVVLPPVYQCEQGHHACATCWTKVLTCPLCKRPQSCTRNYMAEALVEQVPLPCRYHIEGCKETVQHNSKVNHEENCSYRMYQCPVAMCNQALSYQNMCKHFKKHHKNILHHEGHSVGKGEKFCDVLYKEAVLSSLVHAFDITKWGLFFLREVAVGRSTAFFVQVMPAASDQAVYFYHLEVCDHHDCRKECFKGRVFPMCKPSQEIIDQEEYLCLSELILKTVKKTTPLKIVVTIWQLKPAFTLSS